MIKQSKLYMLYRDGKHWRESTNQKHCELYDKKAEIDYVLVEEDSTKKSIYWAFWENESQQFKYIWPSDKLVKMCFPYGIKPEEEAGRGKLCQVKITTIKIVKQKLQ